MVVRNQPQEAVAIYEQLMENHADDAALHYDLGVALARLGKQEQALKSYSESLRLDPEYVRAHVNRADVLNQLKRFAEAVRDCNAAIEIQPSDALAWQNRAAAHRGLGELDKAEADLNVALGINPDSARSRLIEALLLVDRRRPQEAAEAFTKTLGQLERESSRRITPVANDQNWLISEALAGRSAARLMLGEDSAAREDLERARALRPGIERPEPIASTSK
jgi:tetratricopeptide (TPR) repeat protein